MKMTTLLMTLWAVIIVMMVIVNGYHIPGKITEC